MTGDRLSLAVALLLAGSASIASAQVLVLGRVGGTGGTTTGTGTIPANGLVVLNLGDELSGFGSTPPRGTVVVTVAAPNNQIHGLHHIVNAARGTISNHVMARPASN